ncbi:MULTISPECIES: sarcosine oxidase subunit gamma [unclassified Mesorhizobium]|uniref:sarcosine oxidase subunit gamma n=1 Tax=unclassified Mesorhizobium TaxID=325217 RepID=UPI0030153BFA
MADFVWTTRSPLQQAVIAGKHGAAIVKAGIRLSEIRDFDLVQVFVRRGQWAATAKAAEAYFGVAAPTGPKAVTGKKGVLVWSGADQFMALSPRLGTIQPIDGLRGVFEGFASLSDQSDGRCLIRLSGPRVRDMLAKVNSLDLHDGVFPIGAAATTSIDHTAVNLWREADAADGSPVFNVLVFSSFADSLWHTLVDSAAEYGIEVETISIAAG